MSMEFKKVQNKILGHMKTFDKIYIRLLDHFLGRENHLSVFFSEQSLGYTLRAPVIKFNDSSDSLFWRKQFVHPRLELHNPSDTIQ